MKLIKFVIAFLLTIGIAASQKILSGTDLYITNDATILGTTTTGDVTITDADPVLNYKDSDGTDGDISAYAQVDLTDTGSGTEDADYQLYQQVAGAASRTIFSDADQGIWLYASGSTSSFFAITGTEARINMATPSIDLYDSDGTDGDVSVQVDVNLTDTGSGTEDADVTLSQQVAGAMTAFLTADADGVVSIGTATQNTTVTGDLTITGDDLFMTTNTTGFILRADGTNYNPVSFVNSSDLAGMMSDETGTAYVVYSDSPTFTTQVTMDGNLIFPDPGTSANSDILYMRADNATTVDEAQIQVMFGADPYLRISAPADAGTATPVLDIHDTNISYGNGVAGVDYVWTVNGETNDGTITYMEDEDRFDFDNDVNIGGALTVTGAISGTWNSAAIASASQAVAHSLGYMPMVWVVETASGDVVDVQVHHTDVNNFTVTAASSITGTIYYR